MAGDAWSAGEDLYERHLGVKVANMIPIDVLGFFQREKGLSLISIVAGLLLSVFGTLMLKDTMPRPVNAFKDDLDEELLDEPRFRL
jgi:hypothetical protein